MGKRTLFFVVVLLFTSYSNAAEVRIAVATNFLATMKELKSLYEASTNAQLSVSAASSGKIYAQIINGAPFDLFLSADQRYVDKLIEQGKAVKESRYLYARGVLVLWSRDTKRVDRNSLFGRDITRLSIANPRLAPYGLAALQTLDALGLSQALKAKIVTGESVGQAFQFVATGNAEYGFVARSQVLNPKNVFNRSHYWLVPTDLYSPILQEAVLLTRARNEEKAMAFMHFLKSDAAKSIIFKYGYM